MPILDVTTHLVSAPLHTPFVTALRRTTTTDTVVVVVTDEHGHRGYGEAPQVWRVTGESLAGARACIDGPLRDAVLGRDPDDLHDLLRTVRGAVVGNHGAKGAVDVALHDLAARRLGVPLAQFLGGSATTARTDVTLSVAEPDELAATAAARVAEGFDVLKIKVGTDAVGDVARVRAIRAAVGPGVRIRLDANQGWTPRQAVRAIRAMEDAGTDVELVEQPVDGHDVAGLAHVTAHVDTLTLADEAVYGIRELLAVIERRAADMVNVKLAKSAGLGPARTLLDLAEAAGMGTMVGSMMETHIGVGAAASLVAAYGTSAVSDLDAAWWLTSAPVTGGITYEGPTVRLPDAPGLGIDALTVAEP
ncbi:mandelate racemase/muconate lactonizing enzyme family protein [Actinocatenispora rupis]|uniref:Dipeptide epimerase n=1 Tax=Actinocatenispora rupis TaxID=519421 RepID=A0A8J3NAB8_9ACTN|nr:dipeptide epimerase [Actinocatenispora rupis]GID09382.1 L-Ala-D/L-Glu epimerase [Actinocatenispora rupis]